MFNKSHYLLSKVKPMVLAVCAMVITINSTQIIAAVGDSLGDGDNHTPDVSMASNGDFVIVWRRNDSGSRNIYAQRFNAGAVYLY